MTSRDAHPRKRHRLSEPPAPARRPRRRPPVADPFARFRITTAATAAELDLWIAGPSGELIVGPAAWAYACTRAEVLDLIKLARIVADAQREQSA
jgi:hypothetical protein